MGIDRNVQTRHPGNYSLPRGAGLILLLWCFLLLPESAFSSDPSIGGDLQIKLTMNELLGEQGAALYAQILPPEQPISWEVYLPVNSTSEIPGVLVYVSPQDSGQIDARWRSVMDQQNLIYIAANDSGNRIPVNRRMVLAIMALKALRQLYEFANDRISISGFSGGGKVASFLASHYPEIFTGAIYICGVEFWKKDKTPNVERLLQNRFVFLSGSRDFNRAETSVVYRRYLKAGAHHSKLMVIPGMSHEHPDAQSLSEALVFLYNPG